MKIGLSLDKILYERTNYSLLNLVGDIGALYSTLAGIASFILKLIRTDVVMENHLINKVFTERPLYHTQTFKHLKITYCDWIKQVPYGLCPNWRLLREHRITKLRKVGLRRIERELDIARFIRKQIAITAIIKALTTKAERNFLKHNY